MTFRKKLNEVIFGTQTPMGKRFDLCLIFMILLSVLVMMLDSVNGGSASYHRYLGMAEWFFTGLFTLEYALRLYCSPRPLLYARSYYGAVDFLSILPSYLGLFLGSSQYLMMIRLLRVMRIFRVLKLIRYLREGNLLLRSILLARRKILLFFVSVLVLCTIFGSLMFVVEGPHNGFTSIPKSIYWTIVTITTVGYGDITPQTPLGQVVAAMAMLLGYSIIAVPTGILTAELAQEMQRERSYRQCSSCNHNEHESDADFCRLCGEALPEPLTKV